MLCNIVRDESVEGFEKRAFADGKFYQLETDKAARYVSGLVNRISKVET